MQRRVAFVGDPPSIPQVADRRRGAEQALARPAALRATDFAACAAVPLSSVRRPREELDRTAAQLLLDEVRGGDRHRHRQVVCSPELVVRESSGGP